MQAPTSARIGTVADNTRLHPQTSHNLLVEQFDVWLQVVGDSALADTLGDGAALSVAEFGSPALDVSEEDRSRGVGEEALHPSVAPLLENSSDSGQRPSRPGRANEAIEVHPVGRLRPDLGARRLDVRLPVSTVVELVCPVGILEALCVSLRLCAVSVNGKTQSRVVSRLQRG